MDIKNKAKQFIEERYSSVLIDKMRADGFRLEMPPFTFYLAEEFGFCYGVDKAVTKAFETRFAYPQKRIFLTHEIIHNPQVNKELKEVGIEFLDSPEKYQALRSDDIVLIPAFGISVSELERLKKVGCQLVDTACGSVVAVWKRVERYAKEGFTSVIHGKYDHEETIATSSQAVAHSGHYLVIKNMKEAEMIACFIERGEGAEEIRKQFKQAASPGFDPEKDLAKIGCANQTTMLSSESLEIAECLKKALAVRYGATELENHFRHFGTICSATQDRQDAVRLLIESKKLDLVLVIGGFKSSNTAHLVEIAEKNVPTFHVSDADDLISLEEIRSKKPHEKEPRIISGWLPKNLKHIGITAGASTPNRVVEDVVRRFIYLHRIKT